MIDWTYSHFRVMMRLLAPQALLYTDMISTGAILNKAERILAYHPMEKPLALQIGGADKDALVKSAQIAEQLGFDEINLNLGCPSDKVQAGRFGACLMAEAEYVAECIQAMKQAVSIPVTAKTRIGIDEHDSYPFFANFVHQLVDAGCDKLIVHARKAWLKGLSPKQNRTIPPVRYDYVYQIKQELTSIPVVINGNIHELAAINQHLTLVDGVMVGRLACQNPYAIATLHQALFSNVAIKLRSEVVENYLEYLGTINPKLLIMSLLLKPLFNLMHGMTGCAEWKKRVMAIQQSKDIKQLATLITFLRERNL